jgi:enoyl-CoA hydratase/carnithine racemase
VVQPASVGWIEKGRAVCVAEQTSTDGVLVDIRDGVAEVTLNRPERRNAVRSEDFEAILEAAARLRRDLSVRAVILTGAGPSFCAGMDTSGFDQMRERGRDAKWRPDDAEERARRIVDVEGLIVGRGQRTVLVWRTLPVPVIAAVRGAALGLGLQLALAADIRIMAPDSTLGAYEIRWGIAPDSGGTQLLPSLIGLDQAMVLCTTGRSVSGTEALTLGLATSVAEDPLASARDLARSIAERNPEAVRSVVRLLRLGMAGREQEGLRAEREEMWRNIGSDNQREAVAAAREGRPPKFHDPKQDFWHTL